MFRYLARRLLNGLLVLLGVVSLVFLIFNLKQVDPARMLADQRSSPEALEAIRKDLGLDLPMGTRYLQYLNDISPVSIHARTDRDSPFFIDLEQRSGVRLFALGGSQVVLKPPYLRRSFQSRRDVSAILAEAFPNTAILALVAMAFAVVIGIAMGTWAAVRKGTWVDTLLLGISALGMAGPSFFIAVLVAWLGGFVWYDTVSLPGLPVMLALMGPVLWLRARLLRRTSGSGDRYAQLSFGGLLLGLVLWVLGKAFSIPGLGFALDLPGTGLPMSGDLIDVDPFTGPHVSWKHLVLPALTLGVRPLAIIVQLTRSSLLEVLAQDHIRTARAKGLSERQVVLRHGLRNALMPVLTAVSGWFASLLAGAVFVEFVFGWKGMGLEVFNALEREDFPVVMGAVLVFATLFVVMNLLVDLLYAVLDPRVRTV